MTSSCICAFDRLVLPTLSLQQIQDAARGLVRADIGDDEHQGYEHLGLLAHSGGAAPDPVVYELSSPLFQPLAAYAARGRVFPAPARRNSVEGSWGQTRNV